MSCDSYYGIGESPTHAVCQDYALHGSLNDVEYIIIADGCSSSKYSEVGAQILCHAAKFQIEEKILSNSIERDSIEDNLLKLSMSICKRAEFIKNAYPISGNVLEATLLIAIEIKGKVYTFTWGDGVIIADYLLSDGNSKQFVTKIEYSLNAPFYLVSDPEKYLKWCKRKGVDSPTATQTYYFFSEGKRDKTEIEVSYQERFIHMFQSLPMLGVQLSSVTICSDGITSYQDSKKEDVRLDLTIPELVAFKNTTGEFVKKRMFFFDKKAKKKNWSHYDDISCGTIYLNGTVK